MLYSLQNLKNHLPSIIVRVCTFERRSLCDYFLQGIPTAERVVFANSTERGNYLLVEVCNMTHIIHFSNYYPGHEFVGCYGNPRNKRDTHNLQSCR